ncbi:unnamed protein product [Closterium sp. NIES-54]
MGNVNVKDGLDSLGEGLSSLSLGNAALGGGRAAASAQRAANWKATGIIALRDAHLKSIPDAVFEAAGSARTLDASNNRIVGSLSRLERLSLANNKLQHLPDSIGQLSALVTLDVSSNCLSSLPPTIGSCSSLQEISLQDNRIAGLPPSVVQLSDLRTLALDNNRLTDLPAQLLVKCQRLHTVTLRGNAVTLEQFEQMEGYTEYEERRRTKVDKRIAANVLLNDQSLDIGIDRT